jgi:transcriptional regulator with XRE-family HTH domain
MHGVALSAERIAKTLGVQRQTVERWESGEIKPPIEQLKRYCLILVSNGLAKERGQEIFFRILTAVYPQFAGGNLVDEKPAPKIARDYAGGAAYHLHRLGVRQSRILQKAKFFSRNDERLCVGNAVSLYTLNGTEGIPTDLITFIQKARRPNLPEYIREKAKDVVIRGQNRTKVFLTRAEIKPLDENKGIAIEVAPARYSFRLAMQGQARKAIENDLIAGRVRLCDDPIFDDLPKQPTFLPCALHCDGIVLTDDGMVVLAQRSRNVSAGRLQWTASLGEGMEWNEDRDPAGRLHPIRAIWRGLDEELGLSEKWMHEELGSSPLVNFMDLAFDLTTFVFFFSTVVECPNLTGKHALSRARRHAKELGREQQDYALLEFTPEACARAITTGRVIGGKLADSGRFNLLIACLKKFETRFLDALAAL